MKPFYLILSFLLSVYCSNAQQGVCKITKVEPCTGSKSKLTIKFVNPQGKPAISRIMFKMNNDTVIQPEIDKTGTYVMALNPGTYSFNFFVKYWYDVNSKPIILKPKTNTNLLVKFDAIEIGSKPVR